MMRLLIITATILSGFLALTMAFFKATHKTFPGFGHWAVGGSILTVGYIAFALRGFIPDGISILIVNLAFSLAMVVYLDGTLRFLNRPQMSRLWYAFPVAATGVALIVYYLWDRPEWRLVISAIAFSVPHFVTAAAVFRHSPKNRSPFYPIIGCEMASAATLVIARAAWGTLLIPDFSLMMESPVQHGFFISVMVLQIVITVSFIMLNTERIERDLWEADAQLEAKVNALEKAMSEVRTLSGLLPICANCKKIRDDKGEWIQMEVYVRDHTEADFTHSICPPCSRKLYPQLYKDD